MNRISNFVKNFDIYGQNIQLKYKGEDSFKTPFGGILTFLSYFVLSMFLYDQFLGLVSRDAVSKRLNSSTNVVTKPSNFSNSDLKLEIAVKITSSKDHDQLLKYFRPTFGSEGLEWINGGYQPYTINHAAVPCGEDKFLMEP